MSVSIPRESVEFVAIAVTVDDVPVTSGVTISVVAPSERPVTFVTPDTLAGELGYMTAAVTARGSQDIWGKVADTPETPVFYIGRIIRT